MARRKSDSPMETADCRKLPCPKCHELPSTCTCKPDEPSKSTVVRAVRVRELFLPLTFLLFAVFNIPGRLIVDGTTKSWFAFSVWEPVRSAYNTRGGMTTAELKRGWPCAFQNEVGYHFITKEERSLFLPKPDSPTFWRQLSIPKALANLAVSGIISLMLLTALHLIGRWTMRSNAL